MTAHNQAAGAGTTGATPPTHTVGSVSDGTVTWAFLRTFPSDFASYRNIGTGNRAAGNFSDTLLDSGSGNAVT